MNKNQKTLAVAGAAGLGLLTVAYFWSRMTALGGGTTSPSMPRPPSSTLPGPTSPGAAQPTGPNVIPVTINRATGLDVHSSPGGTVIGHLNFRADASQIGANNTGWIQISTPQITGWVCSTCPEQPNSANDISAGTRKPWVRPK